jgi:Fuc2NAc and GlcNAc transferase
VELIIILSSFTLSLILTYFVKVFALKFNVIDIPNIRSSHANPTPRGGGLAIVITWFFSITMTFIFGKIESSLYYAFLCGLLLAIISMIDDIFDIKPVFRLFVQTLTAIMALYFLKGIDSFDFFGINNMKIMINLLAVVGIVWFINLFNFLDGIDGYASIETIIMAVVMYFYSDNYIFLFLVSATSGFLYWNWPKAKIFMGDIGSTQLGFILVVFGIYFHNTTDFSIIHWLLLSSLFWFDATLTLLRRIRNREKLSEAHKKHVYQRAVQSGYSHLQTIIFSVLLNLVIIGLVLISLKKPYLLFFLFLVDLFFLYTITRIIDKKVPFK